MQFVPMFPEQFPGGRGRFVPDEQPPLLEVHDARPLRPVDVAMGPVMSVPTFVVDVHADATALHHLDHGCTVLRMANAVKFAERSLGETTRRLRLLEAVPQNIHMLQRQPGANRHAREGVVGDVAGHAGDFHQQIG